MHNVLKINIPEINKDEYKNAGVDPVEATKFWNVNNPFPHLLLQLGLYHTLREHLFTLLRLCNDIDPSTYDVIHKGHPFFFIGISSFRLRDYQTAISFFDAALSEDLKLEDGKERPSVLFFTLKGDNPNNAAQVDTKLVQSNVKISINHYNELISQSEKNNKSDIDQFRENFIYYILDNYQDAGLRTLLTAFITFLVEWEFRDNNFELGIKNGTSEPFFMHLFRGCVLLESLLNRNPNPKDQHKEQKDQLGKLINYYRNELFLPKEWKFEHNNEKINNLGRLIEYLIKHNMTIEYSFKVSYWLRNNLGHNIAWQYSIDRESYRKLFHCVVFSCFHVINCLWKSPD